MPNLRRHALLALLASQEGEGGRLGKKAAQKFVHILSSIARKNYGYTFSFYTYGAFSRALAQDLDILSSQGILDLRYDSTNNSYKITATDQGRALVESQLDHDVKKDALRIWEHFSGRTALELELISTILFVRDADKLSIVEPKMNSRVKDLKPKYTQEQISSAQNELDKFLRSVN